jgi:hypothetical protein
MDPEEDGRTGLASRNVLATTAGEGAVAALDLYLSRDFQ